jgi:hypothetical protein
MLTAGSHAVSATIWRVNNNPGVIDGVNTFSALDAAVSAAAADDTIFIEGSVTPYSAVVTVDKTLYILGPGFYLPVNVETQHIKNSAKVGRIVFAPGSQGSVLAGVEQINPGTSFVNAATTAFAANVTAWGTANAAVLVNDSNIRILNSRLYMVEIQNDRDLKNIFIQKCWFGPGVIRTTGTSLVAQLVVGNNFFRNETAAPATANADNLDFATPSGSILLSDNVTANINNNTFYRGFRIVAKNSIIANNAFFFTGNAYVITSTTNDYLRNLFTNPVGGMTNGDAGYNLQYITSNPLDWFSGSGGNDLYDAYFLAKSGSPSPLKYEIGANEYERGMYGGLSPYIYSGLTSVPAVYEIVMPVEVTGTGFDVTVKVRAH